MQLCLKEHVPEKGKKSCNTGLVTQRGKNNLKLMTLMMALAMEAESEFCTEIVSHDQRGEKWMHYQEFYGCVHEEYCVCSVCCRDIKLWVITWKRWSFIIRTLCVFSTNLRC
jgi:hypothetical protein